ncbi:MAG: DUF1194 domain-containing protein [Bauldia litoralis]
MRAVVRTLLAIFLFGSAVAAGPGRATAEPVDLELVLAVDVSGSVDAFEAQLQREGYLRALVHPQVLKAITSGERKKIAVTYVEWAGGYFQRTVVDWAVISDEASARAFVARLNAVPVITERWTSISGAIDFAMERLKASPHKGERRVIDISGDGPNNSGRPVREARDQAVKAGVTINGLPIVNDRPNPWGRPPPPNLDKYYFDNVIGGPGAFIVVARGFKNFAEAIRNKMVREIAGRRFERVVPAAAR